jgi:hypothetical protein
MWVSKLRNRRRQRRGISRKIKDIWMWRKKREVLGGEKGESKGKEERKAECRGEEIREENKNKKDIERVTTEEIIGEVEGIRNKELSLCHSLYPHCSEIHLFKETNLSQ